MVMIGIDPHKRTRTAVAIDGDEQVLGERLVRATAKQVPELVEWAKRLDGGDRVWVIESAGGLGHLLAQQFLAAGETVVDIPASLGSRVRLLDGTVRQQRPQRRPIGGDRGAASTPTRAGAGRGPRVGVGAAGAAPHPARLDLQTRPHADCTPDPRTRHRLDAHHRPPSTAPPRARPYTAPEPLDEQRRITPRSPVVCDALRRSGGLRRSPRPPAQSQHVTRRQARRPAHDHLGHVRPRSSQRLPPRTSPPEPLHLRGVDRAAQVLGPRISQPVAPRHQTGRSTERAVCVSRPAASSRPGHQAAAGA
jgi:hypothetical protein